MLGCAVRARPPPLWSVTPFSPPPPQYYEMSYGLNIEMHKQVSILRPLRCPGAL